MKIAFLSSFIKNYCAGYTGISATCWQMIFLICINNSAASISFFLSLYFVKDLDIHITLAGIIISFYGLGTALGGIISGKLCDKFSATRVSIISLVLRAITFLLLLKIKTISLLIINLFVSGLSAYGFKTASTFWILNSIPTEAIRLKAINITYASSNLGIGIAALAVGWLARYGFHIIFALCSALLCISAIYLTFQKKKFELVKAHTTSNTTVTEFKNPLNLTRKNNEIIWIILSCLFVVGLVIAQLSSTYPIYLTESFPQIDIKGVSFLFALNSFLIILFQVPIVNLFADYNKILMVGVGAFLYGFGMFILAFPYSFFIAIISCLIYTAGEMLFMSMAPLVCYQQGAEKKKGQSVGLFQMVFAISIFVGPTLGSFIYHHAGSEIVWYISGLIGLSCLLVCGYYRKYT